MAYKQGSSGLAILIGIVVFIALNALMGMFLWGESLGTSAALQNLIVWGFLPIFTSLLVGVFAIDSTLLMLAIAIPIMVGALGGIISRGSAGRGFMAGFSSVTLGFYVWNLIILIIALVEQGSGILDAMVASSDAIVLLLSQWLFIPIIAGIFGGIGGAILSTMLASNVNTGGPMAQPITSTTIIQAPAAPAAAAAAPAAAATSAAKVLCPSCKAENDGASTFCQSCGTRLKS